MTCRCETCTYAATRRDGFCDVCFEVDYCVLYEGHDANLRNDGPELSKEEA